MQACTNILSRCLFGQSKNIVSLSQLEPGFWFKLYSKLGNSSACELIYEIYVNIIFPYFSSMPTLSSLRPRSHLPPRTRINLKQMFDHLSEGLRSEAFKAKRAKVSPNVTSKECRINLKQRFSNLFRGSSLQEFSISSHLKKSAVITNIYKPAIIFILINTFQFTF